MMLMCMSCILMGVNRPCNGSILFTSLSPFNFYPHHAVVVSSFTPNRDIMACCTKTLWALQAGPAYCLSCFYYYLLSDGSSFPSLRDKDVEKIT